MRVLAAILIGSTLLGAAEQPPDPIEAQAARAVFVSAIDAAPAVRAARLRAIGANDSRQSAGILADPTLSAEARRMGPANGLFLTI